MLVFSTFLPNVGKKVLLYSLQVGKILFTLFVWQKMPFLNILRGRKYFTKTYFLRDYTAEVSVSTISGEIIRLPPEVQDIQ